MLFGLHFPAAPVFAASFATALLGTCKVFVMGACGWLFVRRGWVGEGALRVLGQLVGLLTLPCLIFYRIATRFDPHLVPGWWKYLLAGTLVTLVGLPLGRLVARRHGNNDEATLLVGYQNAGFFVLPMLQTLLPPHDYERASLLLFIVFTPFNASIWFAASWFLLKRKSFAPRAVFTPTFCATVGTMLLYGVFHGALHRFDNAFAVRVLLGELRTGGGALQQLGDLTVPLATFALGGSVAATPNAPRAEVGAALEVAGAKLLLMPLFGLLLMPFLLRWLGRSGDHAVALLFTLQWAAPPASALAVFAGQHGYRMKLIPLACLVCYALCLVTVPLWVALSP